MINFKKFNFLFLLYFFVTTHVHAYIDPGGISAFVQILFASIVTSIIFLNSILKLCESKKIVIVLLGSPLHSNYLSKVPEDIIKSYDSLLNIYRNDYLVFDYTYNNYVDSLFLDNDHLNEYGAKKFTLELNSFLDK